MMPAWTFAAIACLIAAAAALAVGEQSLVVARDARAVYWLATGALFIKATCALARGRA